MTSRKAGLTGIHLCLALCLAAIPAPGAAADGPWALCGDTFRIPERPPPEYTERTPGAVYLAADQADQTEAGVSNLRGNVQILRDTQQVQSDVASHDRASDVVTGEGNVRYWEEGRYLTGERARIDTRADESEVHVATFMMEAEHGHGTADRIRRSGPDVLRIDNGTYTTCNPGDEVWVLEARAIKLDRGTDVGIARDVWVTFKDWPVFYSPFLTFPLSDARKSGFLAPSFRVSGLAGTELLVPYYFNLAPNYDATLTARGMTDRGLQLQGEFRYLTHHGEGEVGVEVLPHDSELGKARGALRVRHFGYLVPRWYADVDYNSVSDKRYFEDLGTSLAIASSQFQERRGDLYYHGDGWFALGRLQNYQTLDGTIPGTSRPYERLPQLYLGTNYAERNRRLNLLGHAEAVRFERDDSVTGTRLDLRPAVSLPLRTAGTYLVPKAALRHTVWALDNTAPGASDSPSRTVPTFSVDGGAVFERELDLGGGQFLSTLEPRLFYLNVPFTGQNDLPVFDTGRYTFDFAQLFREDRFSGADRVGDTHQLSLALTTRLLRPGTGEEVMRASVGQIRYLDDRKVALPGAARETRRSSDFVAEIAGNAADWRASAGLQWDPREEQTSKSTVALRYQPDARRVLNLAYRFVRALPTTTATTLEQTDLSLRWPLNPRWSVLGRWNYALPEERTLEAFAGFEYESCCWAVRAIARRYVTNTSGESTNAVFLQVELKGLAGVGKEAAEFATRSIPGYQNSF